MNDKTEMERVAEQIVREFWDRNGHRSLLQEAIVKELAKAERRGAVRELRKLLDDFQHLYTIHRIMIEERIASLEKEGGG